MTLSKENILFERDGEGKLISEVIKLEKFNDTIEIIPLTRGDLTKTLGGIEGKSTEEIQEAEKGIIKQCLIKPKLTDKEINYLKPIYNDAIVTAIISASTGMSTEEIEKKTREQVLNKIDADLKKK